MDNGPISVSAPGKSLIGASASEITFSTRFPFHKLDSTNMVSFEVITLFLAVDTPNPAPPLGFSDTNSTLVHFYPHDYTYVPSSWFLVSLDNFKSVSGSEGLTVVGNTSGTSKASAQFRVEINDTNVNFYIDKFWLNNGIVSPPSVLGLFITVRAYIFVEDLSGTGVPSHA